MRIVQGLGGALLMAKLPLDRGEREGGHFDIRGTILFLVGLVGLQLALSLLAMPGLSWMVIGACVVVGVAALAAFARIEAKAEHPFLHLELFTDPRLALPNLAAALNALARGEVLFLLTFSFQGPYGLNPFLAGLATAPFGLAFALARLPEDLMAKIFLYGGGMAGSPVIEASLLDGIRLAFLASFVLTLAAAVLSSLSYRLMAGETQLR